MTDFAGKTAVITGAASGFGKAFAAECARRGMRLVLADIDAEGLEAVASGLTDGGARVTPIAADVSLYDDVRRVIRAATETYGSLDLLFNNAGVFYLGSIWDVPARDVEWMFGANTLSVFYGMREAIPIMLAQGTPCHIVNTASAAGLVAGRSMSAYNATKHAVVAASEAALMDLQAKGAPIGVSVFCPTYVQTGLARSQQHRPPRYAINDDPYYQSAAFKKSAFLVEQLVAGGEPVDAVVPAVFSGIEENQFYIRTQVSDEAIIPLIKKRCANMVDKVNPDGKT